jgi:hypothetical protein
MNYISGNNVQNKVLFTLRLGRSAVGGQPPNTVEAALAAALTPADRAAPPAATSPPTFVDAAAPIAAPALKQNFNFSNQNIFNCQRKEQLKESE